MNAMRAVCPLGAALLILMPGALHGQAFRSLGFLNPHDPGRHSRAWAVSGDGSTVVGEASDRALRWRVSPLAALEPLGVLTTPGGSTTAEGVSADGKVVVGWGNVEGSESHAFRWVQGVGMADLGTLPGGWSSAASAVSANGAVVVGWSTGVHQGRGFRWTVADGMKELPALPVPGKGSEALDVSADGNVVVGRGGCCEMNVNAVMSVRWTQASNFAVEALGDLPGTDPKAPWGSAAGVSADGQVIVGGGGAPLLAFRWTTQGMTALAPTSFPTPTDPVSAMDANKDGSVIVGAAATYDNGAVMTPVGPIPGGHAFIWTAANGIRDLNKVLPSLGLATPLEGWTLQIATAVSDDGNVIAGYGQHNGHTEGWVAALSGKPFPSNSNRGGPPPTVTHRPLGIFLAGVPEHDGFLWDPRKGPRPVIPDPPGFVTAELLAFGLEPAQGGERVDGIAFALEDAVGLARGQWTNLSLVVDDNGNGTLEPGETTTVGGPGFADASGRLVFLQSFAVSRRTQYVLRGGIRDLRPGAGVTVALRSGNVAARSGAARGSASRHLGMPEAPHRISRIALGVVAVALLAVVLILRAHRTADAGGR